MVSLVSVLQTESVGMTMYSPLALELQERSLHTVFRMLTDVLNSPGLLTEAQAEVNARLEASATSFLSAFIHDSMWCSCEVDRCSHIIRLSALIDVGVTGNRVSLCIDKHQRQECQNVKVESPEMFLRPW